jgi:ech hydrogenase subunit A
LVLGSAFTVVFWAKWIGLVLTMSTQKEFKKESLLFSVKSSLVFLVTLTFAVSILIIQVYNLLVGKFVQDNISTLNTSSIITADSLGFHLVTENGIFGGFPVFLFFGLFIITLAMIPICLSSSKNSIQSKPYLCGENTDDPRGVEAYMPGDRIEFITSGNYYLKSFFSEEKLTLWLNLISLAIILIMFGVVLNG